MIITNYTAGLASHGPARYPAAEDEVWTYYPDDKPVSLTFHLNLFHAVQRHLHLHCAVHKQYLSDPARPHLTHYMLATLWLDYTTSHAVALSSCLFCLPKLPLGVSMQHLTIG